MDLRAGEGYNVTAASACALIRLDTDCDRSAKYGVTDTAVCDLLWWRGQGGKEGGKLDASLSA